VQGSGVAKVGRGAIAASVLLGVVMVSPHAHAQAQSAQGTAFIIARGGRLYEGKRESRFLSFNVPNLHYAPPGATTRRIASAFAGSAAIASHDQNTTPAEGGARAARSPASNSSTLNVSPSRYVTPT
jgi:hypothetical protein